MRKFPLSSCENSLYLRTLAGPNPLSSEAYTHSLTGPKAPFLKHKGVILEVWWGVFLKEIVLWGSIPWNIALTKTQTLRERSVDKSFRFLCLTVTGAFCSATLRASPAGQHHILAQAVSRTSQSLSRKFACAGFRQNVKKRLVADCTNSSPLISRDFQRIWWNLVIYYHNRELLWQSYFIIRTKIITNEKSEDLFSHSLS